MRSLLHHRCTLCLALVLAVPVVQAHALDIVLVDLRIHGDAVEESITLTDGAFALLGPPAQAVFHDAPLTLNAKPCLLTPGEARHEEGTIRVEAHGVCAPGEARQHFAFLAQLPDGARVIVKAEIDGQRLERVADRDNAVVTLAGARSFRFIDFVHLGIEHIFTGYDHLFFLLGLLLAGGSLRKLLLVATSFTLAHSITLALAALGTVHLPSRFVESAIAASIVYVAVEDLLVAQPRRRWMIAFAFGLVHGFGFASALAELDLPRTGLVHALVGFNVGVEIGQATIVLAAAPLLARLRRMDWFERLGVPLLLVATLVAGTYWFAERAFA